MQVSISLAVDVSYIFDDDGPFFLSMISIRKRCRYNQDVDVDCSSIPDFFKSTSPRMGKWSWQEERYAQQLIEAFENGLLTDCEDGSTLRSYLARKLNCAPMRISKKFAGCCIGKVRNFPLGVLLQRLKCFVVCVCQQTWCRQVFTVKCSHRNSEKCTK